MNCYLHPDAAAVAYCRSCGRPLCTLCQRPAAGTIFCQDDVPVSSNPNPAASAAPFNTPPFNTPPFTAQPESASSMNNPSSASNPYFQPAAPAPVVDAASTSPVLAFLLGWIPGVGAIYNGQYIKGLVHAVIFGLLITLINSSEGSGAQPLFGVTLAVFVFYMPFEALHTAKKRRQGLPVDEWSSLVARNPYASRTPIGPVVLILLGVLFLLDTLNVIQFRELARYWPVLLIVVGAFMLYSRVTAPDPAATYVPPVTPPYPGQDGMEPRP